MKITDFQKRKGEKQKISMVTCYDFTSARIVGRSAIDAVLVGDSVAMMMCGASQTVAATTDMMAYHTRAVVNGLAGVDKFIVADMPFPTVRLGEIEALKTVDALVKAGAHAVKAEGVSGHEQAISAIVGSGVPVMGHLGLTPQSVLAFGGYRVQGRDERAQNRIIEHAVRLEDLGCFSIVLECIPAPLAQRITSRLQIPTIGIGAGAGCDGQILVWQDLLGLQSDLRPRFVRRYLDAESMIQNALNAYDQDVKDGAFPNEKESYA